MKNKNKEWKIIQHLKTYKKYNTLENTAETLRTELDAKGVQIRVLEKAKDLQEKLFTEELEKKVAEIIKLKEERAKLKKEIRDLKKRGDK